MLFYYLNKIIQDYTFTGYLNCIWGFNIQQVRIFVKLIFHSMYTYVDWAISFMSTDTVFQCHRLNEQICERNKVINPIKNLVIPYQIYVSTNTHTPLSYCIWLLKGWYSQRTCKCSRVKLIVIDPQGWPLSAHT